MKIALFPGSFDPITVGHVEIIERGLSLFDKIVVAIGVNSKKQYMFPLEDRLEMLRQIFKDQPQIEIAFYEELTVAYATRIGAQYLLRGLRTPSDLEYEQPIAYINEHMAPHLETVCLLSSAKYGHISSTIVREIIKYEGKLDGLVPQAVIDYLGSRKSQV